MNQEKSGIKEKESTREQKPTDVSTEFDSMDSCDFMKFLRQKRRQNPNETFAIVADWKNVQTARKAKALLDDRSLKITSITIRATRAEYEKDVNAFQSGVKWEEIIT